MANFSIESAIVISFIIGLILPHVGIGGIISLVIMGFVATYLPNLNKPVQRLVPLPQEFSVYSFSSSDF